MQNPLMRMHLRLQEIKDELTEVKVCGTAGDGMVKIVVRGDLVFESVQLADNLVGKCEHEQIENLVHAAAQDGVRQILAIVKAKTDALREEFGLPI